MRGSLTPDVHLFAEPVVARIDVVVDRDQVDPADVVVKTDFKPYETSGETAVEREDIGRFTHLRYTTTLRCLDERCIPSTFKYSDIPISQTPELPLFPENQQRAEKTEVRVSPDARDRRRRGRQAKTLGRVVWPPLRSLSRINWYDASVVGQGFPFESDGHATAGDELPDIADAPRRAAARGRDRDRRNSSAVPGAKPQGAPCCRRTSRRTAAVAARARACPRRVGESTAFRPRTARGTRGARLRARYRGGRDGRSRSSPGVVSAGIRQRTRWPSSSRPIREDHAPPA